LSINIDPSSWRRRTEGGIPYKLMEGFPKGRIADGSAEAREEIIIQESDLVDFITESHYRTVVLPGNIVSYQAARECPGFSGLYTDNIEFEPFIPGKPGDPFKQDTGAPDGTYGEFIKLSITYTPIEQGGGGGGGGGDDPTSFLDVSTDIGAESIVPEAATSDMYRVSSQKWTDPNDPQHVYAIGAMIPLKDFNVGINKLQPQTEWSVNWPHVSRDSLVVLQNRMRICSGRINSVAMSLFNGAEPGTILFMGGATRTEYVWVGADQQPPVSLSMKFIEKRVVEDGIVKGHNYTYIPDVGKFELIAKQSNAEQMEGETAAAFTARQIASRIYSYESTNLNYLWTGYNA